MNGNPSVESGYLNNPSVFSTLRSAISVPLCSSTNLIGVLSLYHESRDAFSKDQLRLLQSIASKLALSIQAAALDSDRQEDRLELPDGAVSVRHLDSELTRRQRLNTPLALILCVVDGLSRLQTNLGRVESEAILRGLVLSMREGFHESDFIGSMGNGEFLLVLSGLSPFAVRAKASRLMQIAAGSERHRVSVLAAEALSPEDGTSADELLAAADRRIFELRNQRFVLAEKAAVRENWLQ